MPAYHFTDENFEGEVLKSDKTVLVDFWAAWCGPCQMMGPVFEELATENEGKNIKIGKVNVDECPITSGQNRIMSIPTFLVFKNGQVVDQMVGGITKEKLQELINRNI
ncbi:MAG: thioredoxin [Patescibacteria group bacterium]